MCGSSAVNHLNAPLLHNLANRSFVVQSSTHRWRLSSVTRPKGMQITDRCKWERLITACKDDSSRRVKAKTNDLDYKTGTKDDDGDWNGTELHRPLLQAKVACSLPLTRPVHANL